MEAEDEVGAEMEAARPAKRRKKASETAAKGGRGRGKAKTTRRDAGAGAGAEDVTGPSASGRGGVAGRGRGRGRGRGGKRTAKRKERTPSDSEDEDVTDTPLSSQHAGAMQTSDDDAAIKRLTAPAKGGDVEMADAEDDEDDVAPITRRPAARTRGGFVIDSDSE